MPIILFRKIFVYNIIENVSIGSREQCAETEILRIIKGIQQIKKRVGEIE
jgi:hypothetical protein